MNWTDTRDASAADGTNTRLRLGLGNCTEVLVDLPDYFLVTRGHAPRGVSDIAPGIKRELPGLASGFDLAVAAGVALPTGNTDISGRGFSPYLQSPWSIDMDNRWSLNGMETIAFLPSEPQADVAAQTTLSLERQLNTRADIFIESIGNFSKGARPAYLLNAGGAYRLTLTQQVDFHVGFGLMGDNVGFSLNANAPGFFVGLGYSVRLDRRP